MKKLIIALGLVLSVVTFASAQQGRGGGRQMGTPAERAARSVAQLETLKLSDEQKAKLTEIYLAQGKQIDSLRTASQGQDQQSMRSKFGPLMAETNKKILSVFNEEQKKSYEALMEARRNRMRGGNGGGNRNNNNN